MRKTYALLLLVVSFSVGAAIAKAQQAKETRIGLLGAPEEPRFTEIVTGLKKGLGELGYSPQTAQILEMKVARADESGAKP
jgi:hypothetical protein